MFAGQGRETLGGIGERVKGREGQHMDLWRWRETERDREVNQMDKQATVQTDED